MPEIFQYYDMEQHNHTGARLFTSLFLFHFNPFCLWETVVVSGEWSVGDTKQNKRQKKWINPALQMEHNLNLLERGGPLKNIWWLDEPSVCDIHSKKTIEIFYWQLAQLAAGVILEVRY